MERNFLKDLWHLLSRPGFLAREYYDGRRKRHMAPISLFLLINILYFFLSPLTDLNLSLIDQVNQPTHKHLARKMVDSRLADRGISMEEYSAEYNLKSTDLSKSLIVLNVPMMAMLLALVYVRRKDFYFTDHMVFALNILGFVLLFASVMFVLLVPLIRWGWLTAPGFFQISGYLMLIGAILYFYMAVRRFYQQSPWWTVFNTLLLILIFLVTHFLYRSVLFFIVFWAT